MLPDELIAAIRLNVFSSRWSIDTQRSMHWEGVTVVTTPSAPYGGFMNRWWRKRCVTVSIHLDPRRYDPMILLNRKLTVRVGRNRAAVALLTVVEIPGSGKTSRLQLEDVPAKAWLKFELE
jgi:hypothetical protein